MVFDGGNQVLTFQLQHLDVVLVGLPQVAEVGVECLAHIVLLQLGIGDGDAGVLDFASAITVEEVEAHGHTKVET